MVIKSKVVHKTDDLGYCPVLKSSVFFRAPEPSTNIILAVLLAFLLKK